MGDHADKIYAEIQERKRRASELGVPQLIWGIFEDTKHFPSYCRDDPPGYKKFVPPFVLEIGKVAEGGVAFSYEGIIYSFRWSQTRNDSYDNYRISTYNGRLELGVANDRVFELTMYGTQDESSDEWVPTEWSFRDVQAFVEGPWIDRLAKLAEKIAHHRSDVHEADAKKRREDPAKLKDLKDRFGIK
jgi:hypothetical protein